VHPKTGKVCVPIDPSKAYDFDPDTVPTVQSLLKELEVLTEPADKVSATRGGGQARQERPGGGVVGGQAHVPPLHGSPT
jgi:hypothetical protein